MSNIPDLPKRLVRWLLVTGCLAFGIFSIAGRWLDPWLWAYVAIFSAAGLYAAFNLDPDLAKERFRPPEPGADRIPLKAIRAVALAHVIIGALDYGRLQLTEVPPTFRVVGLIGMVIGVPIVFHAMLTNRFFSAVIRISSVP